MYLLTIEARILLIYTMLFTLCHSRLVEGVQYPREMKLVS